MLGVLHRAERYGERLAATVGITSDSYPTREDHWFAKIAFIFTNIGLIIAIVYMVFYIFIGAIESAYSVGILSIVLFFSNFLFKSYSVFTARMNMIATGLGLAGVCLHTGGIYATTAVWLVGVTPGLTALLFRRAKEIVWLTILALVLYGALFIVQATGYDTDRLGLERMGTDLFQFLTFSLFGVFIAFSLGYFSISQSHLSAMLQKKQDDLQLAIANLRAIFSSIDQAILNISEGQVLQGEQPEKLLKLCGENITRLDHFLERTSLSNEKRRQALDSLELCIGESDFQFEINRDHLPMQVNYRMKDETQKRFLLQWSPIVHEDRIKSVLLVIQDVTQLEKVKQVAEERERKHEFMNLLLENHDKSLDLKMTNLKSLGQTIKNCIDDQQMSRLKNQLHTLKGNARQVGLLEVSQMVHHIEELFDGEADQALRESGELLHTLKEYFELYERFFKSDMKQQTDLLDQCFAEIAKVAPQSKLLVQLENYTSIELQGIIEAIESEAIQIASSRGLAQTRIICNHPELMIPKALQHVIYNSLGHLMRNPLAHGFLSKDERMERGKAAQGTIRIDADWNQNGFHLVYSDDGEGLDLQKIVNRYNQSTEQASLSNLERVAELVFEERFSTASTVDDIAGRGVGLAAVKQELTDLDGTIDAVLGEPDDKQCCVIQFRIHIRHDRIG
ncbi:ATP-binding protein [Pseudobacteriovorax antillogorgiicola]|uniref:Hpt domain-containing protein n=2 Tax=Pseudobacteriovorax antillogorgiicola TaxID=1513793 RepID=A0A1Y6BTL8_9BACT|nr:ATP-binding protein [Pseudobacteriovorax antillogorgiicola]TCS53022.1 Hpt domain-containing protein [Pseudobacteriovorax antillogorgiicola]SMF26855.1 Hpt domain-containing protein [Pseudobacteriovorax antillogorgiicola]